MKGSANWYWVKAKIKEKIEKDGKNEKRWKIRKWEKTLDAHICEIKEDGKYYARDYNKEPKMMVSMFYAPPHINYIPFKKFVSNVRDLKKVRTSTPGKLKSPGKPTTPPIISESDASRVQTQLEDRLDRLELEDNEDSKDM